MAATLARIAVSVFKESVRDKVLYNLVFFAVLLIAASVLLGQLTAGQEVKIIKDLGLSAMSIFGLFIAVFIGIGLVSKEVERRSIYALLAKPITRPQFIVGKYLGLVLTLVVNLAIMVAALCAVLAWMNAQASEGVRASWEAPALDPAMLKAVWLILVELMIVTAVALFFSTFSTPLLSAAMTFGIYVAGQFGADFRRFDAVVDSPAAVGVAKALYYVLPNLGSLDIKAQVVHAQPVAWGSLALASAYGFAYIAVVLSGAIWVFSRRDFK